MIKSILYLSFVCSTLLIFSFNVVTKSIKSDVSKIEYNKKTMIFASYTVKDFSKWEKVYKQNVDTAAKLAYLSSIDDITKVGVYQFTQGHDDFRKNKNPKQLKDFNIKAGINSTPDYQYLNVMWMNPELPKKEYYIIISHKVVDFVKWKVDFDLNRANRGYIGITDVFVATYENDINNVTMALATDNYEMCKALFTDEEVIGVLKKAGVVGELNITYWKVKSN